MDKIYKHDLNYSKYVLSYDGDYIFNGCVFDDTIIEFNSEIVIFNNCKFSNSVRFIFKDEIKSSVTINYPTIKENVKLYIRTDSFGLHDNKKEIEKLTVVGQNVTLFHTSINELALDHVDNLKILTSNIFDMKAKSINNSSIENSYVNNEYYDNINHYQNVIIKSSQ